jgi:hypothetical protein
MAVLVSDDDDDKITKSGYISSKEAKMDPCQMLNSGIH